MSKAITERQGDRGSGRDWEPEIETAPSLLREDEPTLARTVGTMGAMLVIFGGLALLLNVLGTTERVGIPLASIILTVGVIGLLAHAAYDRDLQIRRLYWGAGVGLFVIGVFTALLPVDEVGALFGVGFPCMVLALLFLLAAVHHETDPFIRQWTTKGLLVAGSAGAALAFLLGNNFGGSQFLVPYGTLLALLSLAYLASFVSLVGIADDRGYKVVLGMGALGLLSILLGLIRSVLGTQYIVPGGMLYVTLGLLYVAVAVALVADSPLVVLTRREISAFFFSPLIYLLLVGFTFVSWLAYRDLATMLVRRPLPEPIIGFYLWGLWPILTVTFLVPVLTMKLLSEEKRSGSLEVLLTAPVNESTVVLGKFLAAFLLYLLMWSPWWLYLIALRLGGGASFEYRSLFSFILALSVTGAGFVAMGLFFSSLTRNQVASAVLTFAGMMAFLGIYLWRAREAQTNPGGALVTVLAHMDYIELWMKSTDGILSMKYLLFHASAAVIWLFLTVKVLEARRWA
jgi:ABC-2 type transport system permease protein